MQENSSKQSERVDVGALRELRDEMVGTHSLVTGRGIDRWIAALDNALSAQPAPHPDDAAVDAFAAAMKAKLASARAKGRGGWQSKDECSEQQLSDMLRDHVEKGDPRDVANFCMFLHQRGEAIQPAPERQGVEVLIEAVGRVERDMTGELGINWLVEGGIHAVCEGSVLLCCDRDDLTDDDGSVTMYTHTAAPAGVPDAVAIMAHLPDNRAATRCELIRAMALAAAPSAPQGPPRD